MSRILRRPMFRGGQVDSRGRGGPIPGGRVPMNDGGLLELYKKYDETIPMPERREPKGLSTGDYLRIASAGLDILGAPSEGPGFRGALASASKPLSKLGVDLGSSIDAREAQTLEEYQDAVDKRNEKIMGLTGAQAEMNIGELKAQGETGRRQILLESITETKRENVRNDKTLTEDEKTKKLNDIQIKFNEDLEFYVFQGGDVSDFFKLGSNTEAIKAAGKAADRQLKATYGTDYKKRKTYSEEKAKLQAQFLAIMTQEFGKQFAEGGAVTTDVNMMKATPQGITDVNVEEMSTTQPKQNLPQLSYDEIRARLPKEISDDIVTLLANSYEALADFAEIRTQADVDAFNLKYQVQLVLPQEA